MTSELSTPRASRLAIVTAFAAVYTIWGSTYLGIKLAIESVPPFLMSGVRFLLAGAILYVGVRWAGGSLYARRSPTPSQPALATAMEMLLGGVLLTVFGLLRGELGQVHLSRITGTSIGAFVYLVLIGAVIGYSAYIWLLHHVP